MNGFHYILNPPRMYVASQRIHDRLEAFLVFFIFHARSFSNCMVPIKDGVIQLATTVQSIAIKLRSGRDQVDVNLLDRVNTFDKVSHQRLLCKLIFYSVKSYGTP